jgi:hypothetical protein
MSNIVEFFKNKHARLNLEEFIKQMYEYENITENDCEKTFFSCKLKDFGRFDKNPLCISTTDDINVNLNTINCKLCVWTLPNDPACACSRAYHAPSYHNLLNARGINNIRAAAKKRANQMRFHLHVNNLDYDALNAILKNR